MQTNSYKNDLKKIAWGYVFICFDINLGTVSIMPAWIGFILILQALRGVVCREPAAKLLRPFAYVLIVIEGIRWLLSWGGGGIPLPWVSIMAGIVTVYFHFQLLTNLADIAEREGSYYSKRIRLLRNLQVISVTGGIFFDTGLVFPAWTVMVWALVFLRLFTMIGLVWTLFCYAGEADFQIEIPQHVRYILDALHDGGYEACIVGGCVRDALMGKQPHDWDICTSALPHETKEVFRHLKTVDTGIAHGTVTLIWENTPVEITTYRVDGDYEDGRHPKEVAFTRSLEEDLARRDFTINAMAYDPAKGIIDLYGGRKDLQEGLIRCVGEPSKRFQEDGLRIMRGLRFGSVLDFVIESATAEAMEREKFRLQHISKERIHAELDRLLQGTGADRILGGYTDILRQGAPGIELPQQELSQLPRALPVLLAEVFPKETEAHLRDLKYDNHTIRLSGTLSRLKGTPAPIEPQQEMIRFLHRYGKEAALLHYAREGGEAAAEMGWLVEENPCYRVEDLDISGHDLIGLGMDPGSEIGETLEKLLELVIEEKVKNQRENLLAAAKEAIRYA